MYHNPAASWSYGIHLWSIGADPRDPIMFAAYLTSSYPFFPDKDCATAAFDNIDASYEAYCEQHSPEQPPVSTCSICGKEITNSNWYLVDEDNDDKVQHMVCP